MDEKRRVPKLRFPGFTEPWEQRKLVEVVDVLDGDRGKNYPKGGDFDISGHTLFLNASNVTLDGFLFEDNQFISEEKSNSMGNGKLQKDDIVVTSRGSLGHIAWYNADIIGVVPYARINSGMLILRGKSIINTPYLYQFMKSHKGQDQISFMSFGSAQPQLTKKGVEDLLVEFPCSVNEQTCIADFFCNLDNLITLHQRKLDEIKVFKKGMLQKMFPKKGEVVPEIRFAGFTGPWEQRKFSDFAQRENALYMSSPNYPSVEYEDVVAEEGRLNKNVRMKKTQKYGIGFDGTQVLYGKLRPYLHNWLNPDFQGVAVGDWWVLCPIGVEKNFLFRLIQTKHFDEVANQSSGSKMPRADWNLVSNTEFVIPVSLDEQSRIANAFDGLDNLITLYQCKLEAIQEYKKGLIQQMFV